MIIQIIDQTTTTPVTIVTTVEVVNIVVSTVGAKGDTGAAGAAGAQGPAGPTGPSGGTMTLLADATNVDFNMAVNSVKYLPLGVLSQNRTITIPAGANGDTMEFYNNEVAFAWLLAGAAVYLSDGVTIVTQLMANANYLIRKVSGKWRILN